MIKSIYYKISERNWCSYYVLNKDSNDFSVDLTPFSPPTKYFVSAAEPHVNPIRQLGTLPMHMYRLCPLFLPATMYGDSTQDIRGNYSVW